MLKETNTMLQPLLDEDALDADTTEYTPQLQPARRRRRRAWLVTAIIVLILALIAGGGLYWWLNRPSPVQYTQATLTTGNISVKVSATGPVTANAQYNMNFATAGQISEIDVKVGQQVTKGQLLAKITPTTGTNINSSNTDNTSLVAPADATVAAINARVGEQVGTNGITTSSGSSGSGGNSGSSGGGGSQPFIILMDTSQLNISAQVNEVDISNVQIGQSAQFTVSAYPNQVFRAAVSNINTIGQVSSNIVVYSVMLSVDQNSLSKVHLYPGMTATVSITTQQRIGVLLIPASALTFPSVALQNGGIDRNALRSFVGGGQQDGTAGSQSTTSSAQSNRRAVLQLKDGKLVPVAITTGLSSGQFVEVLSGLEDGDSVVTGQTGGNVATPNTGGNGRGGGFSGSGGRGGFGGNGGFGGPSGRGGGPGGN